MGTTARHNELADKQGNKMQADKIEAQAFKAAQSARPGIVKHNGKIYTLVFNQNEWVYDVFEDGFFMMKLNTKKISTAKVWLKDYI
jgi:hypothetical protein